MGIVGIQGKWGWVEVGMGMVGMWGRHVDEGWWVCGAGGNRDMGQTRNAKEDKGV